MYSCCERAHCLWSDPRTARTLTHQSGLPHATCSNMLAKMSVLKIDFTNKYFVFISPSFPHSHLVALELKIALSGRSNFLSIACYWRRMINHPCCFQLIWILAVALPSTPSSVSLFSRLSSSSWRPVVSLQPREAPGVFQSSSGQLPLPLLQKSQPAPSMFEEAGRVLREIRHSKKVLEENLEGILRAKDAETLYYQLEALSGNRYRLCMYDGWVCCIKVCFCKKQNEINA